MTLLRHIFSHSLMLIVIGFMVFAYFNRAELFPQLFPSEAKVAQQPVADEPSTSKPAASTDTETAGEETADGLLESAQQKAGQAMDTIRDMASDVVSALDGDKTDETDTKTAETEIQKSDDESLSVSDMLLKARQAFWQKNLQQAEHYYRLLAKHDPDNADAYGELGNIYYGAGRWQEAGSAYYEAATRLLAQGRRDHAEYLLKVISGLDAAKAKELGDRMYGAS